MSKILHIFQSTFDFSAIDPNSTLLDNKNINLQDLPDACHTSVGDLEPITIIKIAPLFDRVVFCYNTFAPDSTEFKQTQTVLNVISHTQIVENFSRLSPETFTEQQATRPNRPVLWSFGCSMTMGWLLPDNIPKYSDLLAESLQLPLMQVTKRASSVSWSLREIANADIRETDLVVWMISPNPEKVVIVKESVRTKLPEQWSESDAMELFTKISNVHVGVNLLRSKKVNFILVSEQSKTPIFHEIFEMLTRYPEFLYTPDCVCDRESDGQHYGPESHKKLAIALQNRVQCIHDKSIS
jgi:hypothetical protein